MRGRIGGVAAVLVLVVALAACGDDASDVAADDTTTSTVDGSATTSPAGATTTTAAPGLDAEAALADFHEALARWEAEGPDAYVLTYEWDTSFHPPDVQVPATASTTVRYGTAVDGTGQWWFTVDTLFDVVYGSLVRETPHPFIPLGGPLESVSYDEELGYPTSIVIASGDDGGLDLTVTVAGVEPIDPATATSTSVPVVAAGMPEADATSRRLSFVQSLALEQLGAAREQWAAAGIEDYHLEYERTGYPAFTPGVVVAVDVVDGEVASWSVVEGAIAEGVDAGDPLTVDGLFDVAEQAYEEWGDSGGSGQTWALALVDRELGYPVTISVNRHRSGSDYVHVRSLTPT